MIKFEASVVVRMHPKQKATVKKILEFLEIEEDPETVDIELSPEEEQRLRREPRMAKAIGIIQQGYAQVQASSA